MSANKEPRVSGNFVLNNNSGEYQGITLDLRSDKEKPFSATFKRGFAGGFLMGCVLCFLLIMIIHSY
jgi:hypothetical protein